jgi:NADPH-dependent 2,4-dienoyl-CoA reductase/sulfur reductase-like enzyme
MVEEVDVAVIGAGAAGLAAAVRAREVGAERVLVLDRNSELGGILPQCIHTGFGLHYFRENLTGPEYITRFIERAKMLDVNFRTDTMVLNVRPDRSLLATNSREGLVEVRAKATVLAMGCRERTRGALSIPGTRPAGILTAGTAQRLMDVEGYMPGKRIVILGSGDIGMIMARRLSLEGARVEAVVEMLPYPGGLPRNVVQCLEDFRIPLLLRHTVTSILGRDRVSGVVIAELDENGSPVSGTERTIECDTLILSVGLIPENELSEGAGVLLDQATGGPVVDEHMQTSVNGMFACGNVVHVHDLVDHVTETGIKAGESAALFALGRLPPMRRRIAVTAGHGIRYVVPQTISGDNPVTLFLRVKSPVRNARLVIGDFAFPVRVARPAETLSVRLNKERAEALAKNARISVCLEAIP